VHAAKLSSRALLALLLLVSVALPTVAFARTHSARHRHHHHRRHHRHRRRHPAPAARTVTWGSSLAGDPTQTIPGRYAQDAEFWMTGIASAPVPGVRPVAVAPVSGRIKAVLLKVGDDSADVPLRFSVVQPLSGGRTEVLTTSTPHLILPAHSPGVHRFDFSQLQFGMPINKGDYLTVDTPGVEPSAMYWYAAVPGSTSELYTAHGPTQDPGYVRTPQISVPNLELLMQVVEQPGASYHFHVPPVS
jgi:hypothetical protein